MKKVVLAASAPRPIGPYSQAIVSGSILFCSGQIALDPKTGKLVQGGAGDQAEQCLRNIQEILESSGCTFDNVVKTTIYVADMSDFKEVNEAYMRFFSSDPPARTTVGVAALPMGAKVEIEAIATL